VFCSWVFRVEQHNSCASFAGRSSRWFDGDSFSLSRCSEAVKVTWVHCKRVVSTAKHHLAKTTSSENHQSFSTCLGLPLGLATVAGMYYVSCPLKLNRQLFHAVSALATWYRLPLFSIKSGALLLFIEREISSNARMGWWTAQEEFLVPRNESQRTSCPENSTATLGCACANGTM
jgi:hypothetical protein